ncbi:hypothetical protein EXIGLDRAFT_773692 [Exidia glandulosa HHB12029]|uniref:Spindle pole body component n=1 Tax=Exidia glandulosa HHB12029 TaxID=1314781 RepID=A0A165EP10_EXIGL|nr:hypothetical protein EXIGLDRAFT_773692 [Exidia glandulosa HHB12029]
MVEPLPAIKAQLHALPPLEALGVKYHFDFRLDEASEPNDPILAAIRSAERVNALPQRTWPPPQPKPTDITPDLPTEEHLPVEDIWDRARTAPIEPKNSLLTWDALRWPVMREPTEPAFVSELSTAQFDAVLFHTSGGLGAQHSVLADRIVQHLPALLTGCSSEVFVWNATREAFVLEDNGYAMEQLRLQGLDTTTSRSVVARFLLIGSLLRRIESMVDSLRVTSLTPTFHEFLHGLDAVLTYLKLSLSSPHHYPATHLTSIWFHYQQDARMLLALAELCHRDMGHKPPYPPLPSSDVDLLSHIYRVLQSHMDASSPKPVRAACAFLLQSASRTYISELEQLVGMAKHSLTSVQKVSRKMSPDDSVADLLDGDGEAEDEASDDSIESQRFAEFVHAELATAISLARRTLRILQSAKAMPEVLDTTARCHWQWTVPGDASISDTSTSAVPWPALFSDSGSQSLTAYEPQLAGLRVFDMEPGSHAFTASVNGVSFAMSQLPRELVDFIAVFPDILPPAMPTLSHITSLALQPLLDHSRMLSKRLLSLFLESSDLHTHLVIVRNYLLLTGHSFKKYLVAALFSHSSRDVGAEQQPGGILQFRRRTVHRTNVVQEDGSKVHGVGLNLGGYGTAHHDWPPGAADISFSLRRVIVDSLDDSGKNKEVEEETDGEARDRKVWREAESRLGFALRDIPDNAVTEGWFTPDGLDALDFLYLVYRPPHPLDQVVLSDDLMVKYQRIFAFLLRLLRVEEVSRLVHGAANSRAHTTDTPFFTMLPPTRRLLSRFSFQVQAFVTALSGYVFEVAIGKTFDKLLADVANLRVHLSSETNLGYDTAMDVFALADHHSAVLDQILAACLLRTKQAPACEALRNCLTAVLDLGRLVTRLSVHDLADILAAQELQELHQKFEQNMTRLVSLLHGLSEKARTKHHGVDVHDNWKHRHGFVVDAHDMHSDISQLLLRLDGSGWWKAAADKAASSHDN